MQKKSVFIFALIAGLGLLSCKDPIPSTVYDNPDAEHTIMITGYDTEFKSALMEEIVAKYSPICRIEIVDISKAPKADYSQYSAIILMDEVEAWMMMNRKARKIIDKIEPKDKLVAVITAGDEEWEYEKDGVEAITSASVMSEKDEVLEEIYKRVDSLIE